MRIPVPDELLPARDLGRVHFVGIGGAALSGIARIMARRGLPVTGSDNNETPFLAGLRELGVPITIGYDAANLGDAETLVVTTAAREDNPEVVEGKARELRILPRSAGLASVMADHDVLAVAGTHGKTTTTALLTVALLEAGADPTYAVGGVLRATGHNAGAGESRWFVAEADESDGAFLVYSPTAAIVTNVEADHIDQWGSEEAYRAAFVQFLDRIEPRGVLVLCTDDPGAAALAGPARDRGLTVVAVGTGEGVDYRARDLHFEGTRSAFTVEHKGEALADNHTVIPGLYAAGEVACVSVHGANRLGTNSLLDINVFGRRAGIYAAEFAQSTDFDEIVEARPEARVVDMIEQMRDAGGSERVAAIRQDLQATMDINAQVYRTEGSLKQALADIEGLKARYANVSVQDKGRRFNTDLLEAIELGFLLDLAEVLATSALARNESRGGHFREDYPTRDDVNFMRHTMAYRNDDGSVRLDYKPVVETRYKPMERKY